MSIKQVGGVFGRNPEFHNVTATGDISSANAIRGKSLRLTQPDGTRCEIILENSEGSFLIGTDADFALLRSNLFVFQNSAGGDRIDIVGGNLKPQSGKGIDFSATSGTGTSELFDDYEEGTWTPVVGTSVDEVGTWDTSFDATYVKVGRLVTCNMVIVGTGMGFSTTTGKRQYTGLPFQPMDNGSGVYGASSIGQGGGVTIFASGSSLYLARPYDTGTASQIYASFSYQTNA